MQLVLSSAGLALDFIHDRREGLCLENWLTLVPQTLTTTAATVTEEGFGAESVEGILRKHKRILDVGEGVSEKKRDDHLAAHRGLHG